MVQNKAEATYARSDLFEQRRLMDDWAEYLDGERRHEGLGRRADNTVPNR